MSRHICRVLLVLLVLVAYLQGDAKLDAALAHLLIATSCFHKTMCKVTLRDTCVYLRSRLSPVSVRLGNAARGGPIAYFSSGLGFRVYV